MPRFNLLKEIKNTRNTVLPNTPVPGQGGSKISKLWLGLALIVVGAGGFAGLAAFGIVSVSYSPGRTPPIIIDFTGGKNHQGMALNRDSLNSKTSKDRSIPVADSNEAAPDETDQRESLVTSKSAAIKKQDDTSGSQKKLVNVVEKKLSAPVADSNEPAPDETGGGKEDGSSKAALAPVSRPVAEKAAGARGKRGKPESEDVWYIRFALCVMEKSCEQVLAGLKEKGVEAYVVNSVATLTTHRVTAGPWPTGAQARQAMEKLGKRGYKSSVFTSGESYFFSTEPLASQAVAEKQCGIIKASGSGCATSSKKEARAVYKVYQGAFKNKRDAVKKRRGYTTRGIDCIVESG
ncbi:hypothetical protein MNBD_NITROSPINAE04-2368 [hydrothermal vent metagenome]|uniref:SPOR domain-containing protein n=1 Tax=hydrothermal vent metagenome TaxID=652676 RepID=A0A3B1C0X1_9ZZZZ